MALQKTYSVNIFGQSVSFDSAYHQITYLSGDKDNLDVQVSVFDTNKKQNLIDTKSYRFSPDIGDTALNFYKQAYEYLKTLPDYQAAVDVAEND